MSEVNDEIERRWDELLMEGIIVPECEGFRGEISYTFDLELLKEEEPELYQAHLDEVDSDMIDLYNQGIVSIDLSHKEPVYDLTAKGRKYAEDIITAFTSG